MPESIGGSMSVLPEQLISIVPINPGNLQSKLLIRTQENTHIPACTVVHCCLLLLLILLLPLRCHCYCYRVTATAAAAAAAAFATTTVTATATVTVTVTANL